MKDQIMSQKKHYNNIIDNYDDHYYDEWSMDYRRTFIYDPLWKDIDLNGCDVADLACGSGYNTNALLERFPTARPVGFDIATTACERYRTNTGHPAMELDLTKDLDWSNRFDAAIVIGGLHHCITDLDTTLANVARMIRPGGWLMMMEPNADFLLEGLRKIWYRLDSSFQADSEQALCHSSLFARAEPWFGHPQVSYIGGPAYFLILNSMIFRLPKSLKAVLAKPLMAFEHTWKRADSPRLNPIFLARWQRK